MKLPNSSRTYGLFLNLCKLIIAKQSSDLHIWQIPKDLFIWIICSKLFVIWVRKQIDSSHHGCKNSLVVLHTKVFQNCFDIIWLIDRKHFFFQILVNAHSRQIFIDPRSFGWNSYSSYVLQWPPSFQTQKWDHLYKLSIFFLCSCRSLTLTEWVESFFLITLFNLLCEHTLNWLSP